MYEKNIGTEGYINIGDLIDGIGSAPMYRFHLKKGLVFDSLTEDSTVDVSDMLRSQVDSHRCLKEAQAAYVRFKLGWLQDRKIILGAESYPADHEYISGGQFEELFMGLVAFIQNCRNECHNCTNNRECKYSGIQVDKNDVSVADGEGEA